MAFQTTYQAGMETPWLVMLVGFFGIFSASSLSSLGGPTQFQLQLPFIPMRLKSGQAAKSLTQNELYIEVLARFHIDFDGL